MKHANPVTSIKPSSSLEKLFMGILVVFEIQCKLQCLLHLLDDTSNNPLNVQCDIIADI